MGDERFGEEIRCLVIELNTAYSLGYETYRSSCYLYSEVKCVNKVNDNVYQPGAPPSIFRHHAPLNFELKYAKDGQFKLVDYATFQQHRDTTGGHYYKLDLYCGNDLHTCINFYMSVTRPVTHPKRTYRTFHPPPRITAPLKIKPKSNREIIAQLICTFLCFPCKYFS